MGGLYEDAFGDQGIMIIRTFSINGKRFRCEIKHTYNDNIERECGSEMFHNARSWEDDDPSTIICNCCGEKYRAIKLKGE